jgi:hypothetical protein
MSDDRRFWFKKTVLNLLEHGLTRGADALTSLILIAFLQPELFGRLAAAQAWVAPFLLFFLAPETVLYRDFSEWKKQPASQRAARLRVFREFAWLKLVLAGLVSAAMATLLPESAGLGPSAGDRCASLSWAFLLVLIPQVAGPDREYLRLDLRLRELNLLTLVQKGVLLIGVIGVSVGFPGSVWHLVGVAGACLMVTAFLAARWNLQLMGGDRSRTRLSLAERRGIIRDAVASFGLPQHGIGILVGWTQTMDLFILSSVGTDPRVLGLYGAVLKLGNFASAIPVALANGFSIRIAQGVESIEGRWLNRRSALLVASTLGLGLALWGVSPWLLGLLSRGRWTLQEIAQMREWLGWILAGVSLYAGTLLWTSWLSVRSSVTRLLLEVFLPWAGLSVLTYSACFRLGGIRAVAQGNVLVGACLFGLLQFFRRQRTKAAGRA